MKETKTEKASEPQRAGGTQDHKNQAGLPHLPGPLADLHQTVGNQAIQRLYRAGRAQAALKIGQPDDAYEREADRAADQVMRMPESTVSSRQPVVGQSTAVIRTKPG